jgi:malonyl-CoA/methylmalonyl-CoA synthetase
MSETNMLTSNPYDGDGERAAARSASRCPASAARHRRAGKEICARRDRRHRGQGPERVQGLLADAGEDKRKNSRADGFFKTGDVGKIDEQGLCHIVGRSKDLIISGGFNVYPKEIESEINAMPGVAEAP